MTYSCSDFTDDILGALGIEVPEEFNDSPSYQADLALAEIERLRASAAKPATTRLALILYGGIIQDVITDSDALLGIPVTTIDYDTDGADETDLQRIKQPDGQFAWAYVGEQAVEKAEIDVWTIAPPNDEAEHYVNEIADTEAGWQARDEAIERLISAGKDPRSGQISQV